MDRRSSIYQTIQLYYPQKPRSRLAFLISASIALILLGIGLGRGLAVLTTPKGAVSPGGSLPTALDVQAPIAGAVPTSAVGAGALPTIAPAPSVAAVPTTVARPTAAAPATQPDSVSNTAPTTAPAQPTSAPAPQEPAQLAQFKVFNTDGVGLVLRTTPGTTSKPIKTLREGQIVTIIGEDVQANNRNWKHVRDGSGAEGWVAADYLVLVK